MKRDEVDMGLDRALGSDLYCAESVLVGVAEGLQIRSSLIPRIASGFCSGLSRTGGTCGAVNGGVMALGLICGRDSGEVPIDGTYEKVQRFLKQFKDDCGSCNCVELTGCDLGTEEGHNRYVKERVWEKCQNLTRRAVAMVVEIADCDDPVSDD